MLVVLILGLLALVVLPQVTEEADTGETESYNAELHNIVTTLATMRSESITGELDASVPRTADTATDDMDLVITTDMPVPLKLSDYLTILDDYGRVQSGCKYYFSSYWTVYQVKPEQ